MLRRRTEKRRKGWEGWMDGLGRELRSKEERSSSTVSIDLVCDLEVNGFLPAYFF